MPSPFSVNLASVLFRDPKITIGLLPIAATLCAAHATPVGGAVEQWYKVAHRLPDHNAETFCELAVKQGLEPSQQICMRREETARATLGARWQSYPQRKRAQCIRDDSVVFLWCLERAAWQKMLR